MGRLRRSGPIRLWSVLKFYNIRFLKFASTVRFSRRGVNPRSLSSRTHPGPVCCRWVGERQPSKRSCRVVKHVPRTLGVLVLCLLTALGVGGCDGSGANPDSAPPELPAGEWQFLGLGREHVSDVTSIAVHSQDPDVIYAGLTRTPQCKSAHPCQGQRSLSSQPQGD